jgi:hypothetical protein
MSNEKDDEVRQDAQRTKDKIQGSSKPGEDEDTGAHLSPERPIGSQRKATSSSRTPSNED